jgi:DNA-binding transcriptional MerR regulator
MLTDYMTTAEVAEHYRRPGSTIRYWRHIGYGPRGVRMRGKVLYDRAEIDRFDRVLRAEADQEVSA